MPELTKAEVRAELQVACAIAHDIGSGYSLLALNALILEKGLPSREERERVLAARLAEDPAGGNTITSSSPESVDRADTPDASAER